MKKIIKGFLAKKTNWVSVVNLAHFRKDFFMLMSKNSKRSYCEKMNRNKFWESESPVEATFSDTANPAL